MKNTNGQKVKILEYDDFVDTIACSQRVERVKNDLRKSLEIINKQIAVSYSDEGFACFEVCLSTPSVLILSFIGTAC